MSKLTAVIFGKPGCAKCAMLKKRVAVQCSTVPEYKDIDTEYFNVMSVDGITEFCRLECLNPSRIPALVMAVRDDSGILHYLENINPEADGQEIYRGSYVYLWLGTQTDYSAGGVISPAVIRGLFDAGLERIETK